MLTDVGVQFKMNGGDDFESRLRSMENQWKNFASAMDKTPQANKHFDLMATAATRASKGIVSAMNLAKAAVVGFLAVKAVEGAASWIGTGSGLGKEQDYLRLMGASEPMIKAYDEVATKMNRTLAGFSKKDFMDSMFNIQSEHADDGIDQLKKVGETIAYLGHTLKSTAAEASDYYKVMYEAFGKSLPDAQRKAFHKELLTGTGQLLSSTGAKPDELKMAVRQMGPIYAQAGENFRSVLADLGMVVPTLGAERSGTALRNYMSRRGEISASLMEEYQKTQYERMYGTKFRNMSEKQQETFMKGKGWAKEEYAERYAEMARNDPEKYWREMNRIIGSIKKSGGDWQGRVNKAVGEEIAPAFIQLGQAWQSGLRQKALKALEEGDYEGFQKMVTESQKSFDSQFGLFEQKVGELTKTVHKAFAPFLADVLGPYGDMFSRMTDKWKEEIGPGAMANLKTGWDSFWAGFGENFKGFEGVEATFNRIVAALNSGDKEAWIRLGQEWGKWAGESFDGLVKGLQEVGSALTEIAKLAPTINELLKVPDDKKKVIETAQKAVTPETPLAEEKAIVDAQTKIDKEGKGVGWLIPLLGGLKKGVWGGLSGMAWEATVNGPYNQMLHGDVPYDTDSTRPRMPSAPVGPRLAPSWSRSDGLETRFGGGDVTVKQQHENVINLDGKAIAREIAPEVTEIVKRDLESDQGRNRGNALDGWSNLP